MNNIKDVITSLISYFAGTAALTFSIQDIESAAGLACTIICLISMIVTLIINIINKFKKASADGIVDDSELEEIKKTLEEDTKKIGDQINKIKDLTEDLTKNNKEDK